MINSNGSFNKTAALLCGMKKFAFLFVLLISASAAFSQSAFSDSIAFSRNRITEKAMLTLGAWATANIGVGLIMASRTHGEAEYVWRMNAYWNFINLGLAGMGYINARKALLKKFSLSANLSSQQAIEKLYLFNLGLDLVYITGGFYLRERGNGQTKQNSRDQFKGYGSGTIIQGGFLFLMDAAMILLHQRNGVLLNHKIQQLEFVAGPGALGMAYHF
jgi:hypothetical protein